jgi:hypothetical protein
MRSRPAYFIFWFPVFSLCALVTGYFLIMWANAPKIPSQGMEALAALPYGIASLIMAPFLIGLGLLLWKAPRRSALKPSIAIPTIVFTSIAVSAFYLVPRASASTYQFPIIFVNTRGEPVSDLALEIVHSSPGFDIIKGGKTRREEAFRVATNEFNLTKTKGEETEIRIEKDGYYLTKVDVPHVWPAERDYGLQRIHIGWQKDWGGGRWGVDACQAAMNWPLKSKEPFKVVLLDWSASATSPLPEYSEEDFRVLQNANK